MNSAKTIRASRWLRRAVLPFALLCGVVLYVSFGVITVPKGMDTLPKEFPPGTVCVTSKWSGGLQVGSVVFVDLPAGGTLLTRIASVDATADTFRVRHDNLESRLPGGDDLGDLPRGAIRGLVLGAFPTAAPEQPLPRDR